MRKAKKVLAWLAVVLLGTVLAGCGKKEAQVPSKEFVSEDGSVSVMLAEGWKTEDTEVENWIGAVSADESDGILVTQLVKGIDAVSIDDVKGAFEDAYQVSDMTAVDGVTVPGLENVEAYKCKLDMEGIKGEGYFVYGDTDYAFYGILYASEKMDDATMAYVQAVCNTWKETAPEVVNNSTVEATDTIKWINGTYAVLTAINGWDYTLFGGMPANDDTMELQKSLLEEWWDITDKASADETIEWLLSEGHRMDFADMMDMLAADGLGDIPEEERADYLLDNYTNMTDEIAQQYARFFAAYEENGIDVMSAWDYSRVMSVISNCYIAGYYTEAEALDMSLEAASVIQTVFDSWDAFVDSYMMGYEYWAEESADERRAVYEELKVAPDSPYQLDWNLTLEKSW